MRAIKLTKKKRVWLEKIFFSCILAQDPYTDWRHVTEYYKGVTWRHFEGNKHRVLWRVLESFDLGNLSSRREIVLKEKYEELKVSIRENAKSEEDKEERHEYIRELVTAWEAQYELEIELIASAKAWLERELQNVNAFLLVGGKKYMNELYGLYPAPNAADFFANILGFGPEKEIKRLCWNCALAHDVPPYTKCELLNKRVKAVDGYGCEYWQQPLNLWEKLTEEIKGEEE